MPTIDNAKPSTIVATYKSTEYAAVKFSIGAAVFSTFDTAFIAAICPALDSTNISAHQTANKPTFITADYSTHWAAFR